jgi:8-oxo-dGTP pyrophosphatase MutT (NUDIX family)
MNTISPDQIARLLKKELPGQRSHRKMIPPGRNLVVNRQELDQIRYSSVLLLLFPEQGRLYTCLTKRNASMKHHPGQVSFPGGRIEEGESPEVTALREAQEEIGISPLEVRILGRLSELYVSVSKYMIFPYVGWMSRRPKFRLNEDEAEQLLLLSLDPALMKPQTRTIRTSSAGTIDVPCYPLGEEVIWGATAMILTEFFDLVRESSLVTF